MQSYYLHFEGKRIQTQEKQKNEFIYDQHQK